MARVYLKEWRERRGETIRGLAAKSKVSLPSIVRIEGGHRPNPGVQTVEKLAKALGLEFFDIFSPPPGTKARRGRK